MQRIPTSNILLLLTVLLSCHAGATGAESWTQFKHDCRHSGNAPGRSIEPDRLGLVGATALSDAIFTAPVVAAGRVYVVDGSGVAYGISRDSLSIDWRFESGGGRANCNNVSSPTYVDGYLHFGTMTGTYYVLNAKTGEKVREIQCGDPIFSTPVSANGRVYFSTLGSRLYALQPNGAIIWQWDFVRQVMKFDGDRWSGKAWREHKNGRVKIEDNFICSADIAVKDDRIILPASVSVACLRDRGDHAALIASRRQQWPQATTFAISIGETGLVYRQWHRWDNRSSIEVLRFAAAEETNGQKSDRRVWVEGRVRGTWTNIDLPHLMSFRSVSMRGDDIYRCRPERGFGLCRHPRVPLCKGNIKDREPEILHESPALAAPILCRDHAIFGGLDGRLNIVSLTSNDRPRSYATGFGKTISAPVAVCDGHIFVSCEDGYLYVFGPNGKAKTPTKDLELWKIRSPVSSGKSDPQLNRYTSFGTFSNANCNEQGLKPPLKMKWIRRYEGTTKHFSTCGGGRMYTHTAEGQVFAVEQETGRLLWRVHYPGVYLSFTSPLYHQEGLLVPQAGLRQSRLRKLDAATGKLIWEVPFAGSPGWARQMPPVVAKNVVVYAFGTGKYGKFAPEGNANHEQGDLEWLFPYYSLAAYPKRHRPILRAFDWRTGREVWTRDFSEFGSGGDDAGICLLDDVLYYSVSFGRSPDIRRGIPGPVGLTAAIDTPTGKIIWLTTQYSVRGGLMLSGENHRLYLGGWNPMGYAPNPYQWGVTNKEEHHIVCIDARDGSLIWKSDPFHEAVENVLSIGAKYIYAYRFHGFVFDKRTGKLIRKLDLDYGKKGNIKCTRFTLSEPYLAGANMDVFDFSNPLVVKLISSGPRLDSSACVGAFVSNGRLYYTGHGGGLQACQVYGDEAQDWTAPWKARLLR